MTQLQWNKIEYGVPNEGDECAVINNRGVMEIGIFKVIKSYTGKTYIGFEGCGWWINVEDVKYYMVMTRPEEVK